MAFDVISYVLNMNFTEETAEGMGAVKGKDGFSPTVSVSEIDGGHEVTITDVNGPKSFDVMDGKDGTGGGGGGKDGTTFIPSVSESGVISWANNGDLPNPEPVDIKGPPGNQGEPGAPGEPGADATINGENTLQIVAGENVSIEQQDGTLTISATGSGTTPTSSQLINAPLGAIMIWSGTADTVPPGWSICDGTNGTLDLRDKFVLVAGPAHEVGETGGSEEVKLTTAQLPAHSHIENAAYGGDSVKWNVQVSSGGSTPSYEVTRKTTSSTVSAIRTEQTGSSQPHPNMPPYYTALYIQKTGVTPSDYVTHDELEEKLKNVGGGLPPGGTTNQVLAKASDADGDFKWADQSGGGGGGVPSGFIGMWSGATVPDGWALCDGTNGTPDLRGRFVLGATTEVDEEGNTAHPMGETGGSEEVTLTVAQMPKHRHNIYPGSSTSSANSDYLAQSAVMKASTYTTLGPSTENNGSSEPHPNMPPYYVLAYIMKL